MLSEVNSQEKTLLPEVNPQKNPDKTKLNWINNIEDVKRMLQTLTPKRRRCNEIETLFLPLKEDILQTISDGVSVLTVFNNLLPYYPEMSISAFKRMVKSWRPGDNRKRSPFEKSESSKKEKNKNYKK